MATVTAKQSPFEPVVMFLLTQFSEAEAGQSFFAFGQMRSCWAQILRKEFPLHSVCLHPFEDLSFRRLAFSTPGKSLAEQEFKANQFEPAFRPLYQCDAIALFPQTAFRLGEQEGLVGLCHSATLQFPGRVTLVSQQKSLCRRFMKFYAPFSLLVSIAVVARKSTRRSIWHQKGNPRGNRLQMLPGGRGE